MALKCIQGLKTDKTGTLTEKNSAYFGSGSFAFCIIKCILLDVLWGSMRKTSSVSAVRPDLRYLGRKKIKQREKSPQPWGLLFDCPRLKTSIRLNILCSKVVCLSYLFSCPCI